MICPDCATETQPAATVGAIDVCATCGHAVIAGRLAVYADLVLLDEGDLQYLRRARGRIVRPTKRQATAQRPT